MAKDLLLHDQFTVPFRDLHRLHKIGADVSQTALFDALKSCDFARPNRLIENFEQAYAEFCGVRHVVATSSGSTALLLAYLAHDIGPGDEVITVPNTFVATVEAARMLGADVVLADVDPDTYAIDVQHVADLITPKTKAIVPLHPFGRIAGLQEITNLAHRYGVVVIEEACHAHGAMCSGRRVGSLGDSAVFSFGPTKPLAGLGEGGAVATNNDYIAERLRFYNNHGRQGERHVTLGLNFRIHPLEAAYLSARLELLPQMLEERRKIARQYNNAFADLGIVKNPAVRDLNEHSFYIYVVEVPSRSKFCGSLTANGIGWSIHYPVPIHQQEAHQAYFQNACLKRWDCIQPKIVSLPLINGLTEREVQRVVEVVRQSVTSLCNPPE